jgi:PrgI family protein
MATYKVLQDVEAEDKLLGPLTLRQFIYAGIAVVSLYLCYFFSTHSAGFMIIFFLPVAIVAGFFAFPWGKDQPTEVWALAKIRFLVKPRRRIWDQSGTKELVTITAPRQLQVDYTNGLTETEVRSRLHALADTIDSRGWAIKNSNLNAGGQGPLIMAEPTSDRLVAPSSLPQPADATDIQAADDILDENNNADAQRLNNMINQSTKAHRERIVENLQKEAAAPTPPAPKPDNYWFLNQPAPASSVPSDMVTFNTQVVTPGSTQTNNSGLPTQDEASLVAELDARKQELPSTAYYSHLHTILPLSEQAKQQRRTTQPQRANPKLPPMPAVQQASPMAPSGGTPTTTPLVSQASSATVNSKTAPTPPPVTPASQAAILQLANNDDLNVATIAREAKRSTSQDEVVIKLH